MSHEIMIAVHVKEERRKLSPPHRLSGSNLFLETGGAPNGGAGLANHAISRPAGPIYPHLPTQNLVNPHKPPWSNFQNMLHHRRLSPPGQAR